jgi:hypothetical protein
MTCRICREGSRKIAVVKVFVVQQGKLEGEESPRSIRSLFLK